MASAGAHLPVWDRNNVNQGGLILGTEFDDLLVKATVNLKKHLKLDDIWAHLQSFHVLQLIDVERIKLPSRARPDMVEELVNFIRRGGTLWQYHALMRAMALTGQVHLIPGKCPEAYLLEEDDVASTQQQEAFRLSQQLLKDIWDHCRFCKETLLTSHLFTFEGDAGDDIIDLAGTIIKVDPKVKDAKSQLHQREMIQIEGSRLLDPLGDSSPPVTIRLYADPGDGKTSFARYSVYSWSVDFLKQVINKGGKLCLKSGCPKWTLMVFLTARDIKHTVEAAIRAQLGCKNTDVLMAHINAGKGVVIFIDAYDECRDPKILEMIESYVRYCKKTGGPTVVITCRTNLCSIDGKYFHRFVTLSGFSDEQGLEYIKRYTEVCTPLLPQPSLKPPVYEYATEHRAQLTAVLCNPLKLHIFVALALRGEIDLGVEDEFHVPHLFVPLERYLLQREGGEVSEEQSHAFYRLCMFALLNDIREFPESLLEEFEIAPPYHVFMIRSDRRSSSGVLKSYFSFGHEMILEFFASRYILSLNEKERLSFLLVICRDPLMRNVQKLIFELLAQEGGAQINLLQMMVRSMLILQLEKPEFTKREALSHLIFRKTLYDLMHLQDKIKSDIPVKDMLRSSKSKIKIKKAAAIQKTIDEAFSSHADILRSSGWFTRVKDEKNGTIRHVWDCVQTCNQDVQQQLIHNTIHLMLPCKGKDEYGDTVLWYAAGSTRWGSVTVDAQSVIVTAWCPEDAVEAVVQHAATPSRLSGRVVHELDIHTDRYSELWGQPDDDRFTHTQWHNLLQVLPQVGDGGSMEVWLHHAAPVTVLLSFLTQHSVQLAQCENITVYGGTAELEDLVLCVQRLTQQGVNVILRWTLIVVTQSLSEQTDKLHHLKDSLTGVLVENLLFRSRWVTESGEYYVWADNTDSSDGAEWTDCDESDPDND